MYDKGQVVVMLIMGFRVIAISKTVALTFLIILIRNSQHNLHTYQCLCVSNFIKIEQLQICKKFELLFLGF